MGKNRVEAFSDGVLAIVLTVMLLEMKAPHEDAWSSLRGVVPTFVSYTLSFVYVAIYWNNHHHLFHMVKRVNARILWANAGLLFCLSLVPFVTSWMGDNHFSARPVAAYGMVLLMSALAYYVLTRCIVRHHGDDSSLRDALGNDRKGKVSVALYAGAIGLSFVNRWIGFAIYWVVALMWVVPDRRVERIVEQHEHRDHERSRLETQEALP